MQGHQFPWGVGGVLALVLGLQACGSQREPCEVPSNPGPDYVLFEEDPVRPIAASPDGSTLYVANGPADRLEILRVDAAGVPRLEASVPVGLRPVAVAVRDTREVWVVNHLSDSVSVVDIASTPPRVIDTLWVGDEPRDIVFARGKAFIATARRGQRRADPALAGVPGAGPALLTTPGVGRGDVWVFDPESRGGPGGVAGGLPLAIVELFATKPRALAVSPDGATVYAAAFHSGNRTSAVDPENMCPREVEGDPVHSPCTTIDGSTAPGSQLPPFESADGTPAPHVGLVVAQGADGVWRDVIGRDWSELVRFDLPDRDVFAIDTASLEVRQSFSGVGTTLFGMGLAPDGALWVANTESRNLERFEGPGTTGGSTVQGDLARARLTRIDPRGETSVHPLNTHIDYTQRPAPPGTAEASLATPVQVTVSADGSTLWVAAYGSSAIGILDVAALRSGERDPYADAAGHLKVGGGPAGFVLDEARGLVHVLTRFDLAVTTYGIEDRKERGRVQLENPEPFEVIEGRPVLYDARHTSSNGEASCAGCHVFGDLDHLAWDLGNPDATPTRNEHNTPRLELVFTGIKAIGTSTVPLVDRMVEIQNGDGDLRTLHPMKGPMLTQTLRGMAHHGPMHWRGDRMVGHFGADTRTSPPFDSELSFLNFIEAFEGLLGRPATHEGGAKPTAIPEEDMRAFARFALALAVPPNPVRALDRSLTEAERRGQLTFMGCTGPDSVTGEPVVCTEGPDGVPRPAPGTGHRIDGVGGPEYAAEGLGETCEGCHRLEPAAGFFGTDGRMAFDALTQAAKVPQLRSLYDRVGMFGMPGTPHFLAGHGTPHLGEQVSGFGFAHDGTVATLFSFFTATHFQAGGFLGRGPVGFTGGDDERRDVEAYMLAFDGDLAPVVGQQVTVGPTSGVDAWQRLRLLTERARTPFFSRVLGGRTTECDLIFTAIVSGRPARALYRVDRDDWLLDDGDRLDAGALEDLVAQQPVTFTCTTPGSGARLALDHDRDGVCDAR